MTPIVIMLIDELLINADGVKWGKKYYLIAFERALVRAVHI